MKDITYKQCPCGWNYWITRLASGAIELHHRFKTEKITKAKALKIRLNGLECPAACPDC